MVPAVLLVCLMIGVQNTVVLEGEWGAPHVRLTVQKNGATIEFDCAHGVLERRLRLDRMGNFDVPGRYIPEHGGPVRKNEIASGQPVRYRGHLSDRTLTIDIVAADDTIIDRYTVERGKTVRLMKCR